MQGTIAPAINVPTPEDAISLIESLFRLFIERIATAIVEKFPARTKGGPARKSQAQNGQLRGDQIDIFGLDAAKNFLAFVEIVFLLAIIRQESAQFEPAGNRDGQVVNRALENL